jgi:glycosyltransferase involved in cell wall biosynthesis
VYDCVDEHSEYPWNANWKARMSRIEEKLLSRCNLLSVSSTYLLGRKKGHCSEVIFVPNGVDFELFNKAAHDGIEIAEKMKSIVAPRIVYVGAIMEWFDYELVKKIAGHSPLWSIVLIGPSRGSLKDYSGVQNIHYLGIVQQSDLPSFLKGASVCIIPFLMNDLIKGVNPLKLYEYLAAGNPVVSTALPQVVNLQKDGVIYIGKDHSDFICNIEAALRVEESRAKDLRVEVARPFSWELIYSRLFNRIADVESQASNGN